MNYLMVVLTLFAGGSVLGWVIELFFRRYLDPVERLKKKFVNPGFLVGPCLPIYGTGLIALYGLAHIRIPALEASHPILNKLVVFLLMALAMTFIEFVTGMIFIVHMHLQLWDYSTYWGNIKGVVCPLFTCFWYALAAFYYLIMHPRVEAVLLWLSNNLAFCFFVGFFYGIFLLDVIYSFNVVVRVKALAEEYQVVVKYNEFKSRIVEMRDGAKEKGILAFSAKLSPSALRSMFQDYRENFSFKRAVMTPIRAVAEKVENMEIVEKLEEYRSEVKTKGEVIKEEDEVKIIEDKRK